MLVFGGVNQNTMLWGQNILNPQSQVNFPLFLWKSCPTWPYLLQAINPKTKEMWENREPHVTRAALAVLIGVPSIFKAGRIEILKPAVPKPNCIHSFSSHHNHGNTCVRDEPIFENSRYFRESTIWEVDWKDFIRFQQCRGCLVGFQCSRTGSKANDQKCNSPSVYANILRLSPPLSWGGDPKCNLHFWPRKASKM